MLPNEFELWTDILWWSDPDQQALKWLHAMRARNAAVIVQARGGEYLSKINIAIGSGETVVIELDGEEVMSFKRIRSEFCHEKKFHDLWLMLDVEKLSHDSWLMLNVVRLCRDQNCIVIDIGRDKNVSWSIIYVDFDQIVSWFVIDVDYGQIGHDHVNECVMQS